MNKFNEGAARLSLFLRLLPVLFLFSVPLAAEMVVQDVALSGTEAKTYFILKSTSKEPLSVTPLEGRIKIDLPEELEWKAPLTNEEGKGLIQGYRFESGDLVLDLTAEAHVSTLIYRKQNGVVESILILLPGPAPGDPKVEDLIAQDQKRTKRRQQPFQIKKRIPQTVKRVDLDFETDVIRIAVTLTQPETLKVIENDHTHQFFIRMPKVAWEDVSLDPEFEQIVSNYFVDQSHPKWSTLVFAMDRDLTILKREVINNPGQDPIFVLYLGQETGMRPLSRTGKLHMGADLSKIKEENPYEAQMNYANSEKSIIQKNPFSFQTEKPIYLKKEARYKKGTTNYTDISRGPYMGIRAGYSANQTNMSMSEQSGQHSFDYQSAMTGFSYGFFVGYGQNFDKFYAGAELFFDMNREQGRIGGSRQNSGAFLSRSFFQYTYGGALRLGMYAGPESMVYMRLGGVGTQFQYKTSGALNGLLTVKEKLKKGLAGYLYGFGMEVALDNHFSVRMDYDRITYQAFQKHAIVGSVNPQQGHSKFGPRTDRYTLALSYKFNDSIGPNSPSGIYAIPTGFYMGTGLDMSNMFINRYLHQNPAFQWSMKSGTLTPNWMMHMGYGVQYGRYYAGAELSMTFGSKFLREDRVINNERGEYVLRMQPTAGFYLRGGYTFGHANMAYLKAGLLLSSLERSSKAEYVPRLGVPDNIAERIAGVRKIKKSLIALSVGGGLETFVSDNVSIRNEVMHELYQKFSVKEGNVKEKLSPSSTRYQLTMNYVF